MSKCLYVFYNFSTQQSYKLDWFFISFYVFFLLYGQKNAIYAITYRLFSELIKCPFSVPNLMEIRSEKGHFKKLLA